MNKAATLLTIMTLLSGTMHAQHRLIASGGHFTNATDTVHYTYSGTRDGWLIDARTYQLPDQAIARDGLLPIAYDTARMTSVDLTTGAVQAVTLTNVFNANNKVLRHTYDFSGPFTASTGSSYTYNGAGNCTQEAKMNAATAPPPQVYQFKRSFYDSNNRLVADSIFDVGTSRYSNWTIYRYNGAGMLATRLNVTISPAMHVADSTEYTWYSNGRLQKQEQAYFNSGGVSYTLRDTFGYSGINPLPVYHRYDALTQSGMYSSIDSSQLNRYGTGYDVVYKADAPNGSAFPALPDKTLAFYNADSTLERLVYYYGGNPTPAGTRYFYYKEAEIPSSVGNIPLSVPAIRLYPCPTISGTKLHLLITGVPDNSLYSLTDISGRVLRTKSVRSGAEEIITGLPAGIYIITCRGLTTRAIIY